MNRRLYLRLALAASIAAALAPGRAAACGVCVEDKVAATYDHAVVTRATDRGQVVVFAEVKGGGTAASRAAAARRAAARVRGIDPGSVRVSTQPSAGLSFALDARASTPVQALEAVQRAAGLPGLELALLEVMR